MMTGSSTGYRFGQNRQGTPSSQQGLDDHRCRCSQGRTAFNSTQLACREARTRTLYTSKGFWFDLNVIFVCSIEVYMGYE